MKNSKKHPLISSNGLILLLILTAASCSDKPPDINQTPQLAQAKIMTVSVESQPIQYIAVGTVEAKTASLISAKVMGQIRNIAVSEGDRVKKGDLLISIEDSQIQAQLRQAKAGLSEARQAAGAAESAVQAAAASAKLAETTYHRYKSLLETDSVSKQEFDEVESRYQQAKAALTQAQSMRDAADERVAQAEAAVAAAESVGQDANIIAPYDAIVTAKLANTGDMASPGAPLLKIEEIGNLEARVTLPEAHIGRVSIGDSVIVEIPSVNKTLEGKIITIDPAADTASRTFQLKILLPENAGLRTGLFAKVSIPVGTAGMVLIPKTAVVREGQLTGVFILDKDYIARFRLIRTGRAFGDQVEVLSGVKDGDRLVVQPDANIFDGVKIKDI